MKKVFGILAGIFSFTFLFGGDFRFEITPKYTLQNGVLNELVFDYDSNKQSYMLSELNWNIKNSSTLGSNIDVGYGYIDFNCYLGGSIPGISGLMYDSDWHNPIDHSMKTNYSISTNQITEGMDVKLRLSGHFEVLNWLTLKPFINYSYNTIKFVSKDAEGWYGDSNYMILYKGQDVNIPWDDPSAVHFVPGTSLELSSIDYLRKTQNLYLGIELDFSPIQNLTILASGSVSPYSYVDSIDTHWGDLKKTYGTMYNDRLNGFFNFFNAKVGAEYSVLDFLSIGADFDFTYIRMMTGKTFTKKTSAKDFPEKPMSSYSGCSGYLINASIYAKFSF